ncbi:MAG: oligosaccharide flippase family protein [Rudaea sp.]
MKLLNLAYLSGAEFFAKILTFAAIAYLARALGPVSFGYIEFAGSVMLCAGLIVDQGFGPYGAREIARAPERTSTLTSEIVLTRFILALVAYLAVALFAFTLGRSSLLTMLLLLYGLSLLGMPLLLQWVFQGHDRMQTVAVIQLLRQTGYALFIFAFVRSPEQIGMVPVAEVAGVGLAGIYGVWSYRRAFHVSWSPVRLSRRLFREGVPIGLSQLFWMVRMYGATVILGLVAVPADVGFFGAAMRILVALHAFIYLYYFNLLPSFSRAWLQQGGQLGRLIAHSLHGIAWAAVLALGGWLLMAPVIVGVVYGPAFAPAASVLLWLAGVAIAALISGHYRFGLIAAGRQDAEMASQFLGSLLALVLLPFGYSRGGPNGAAAALVLAEVVVWFASWFWARRALGIGNQLEVLWRPALALLVGAGVVSAVPNNLALRGSAFAIVIGLLALGSDRELRDMIWRFAGGAVRWRRGQIAGRAARGAADRLG